MEGDMRWPWQPKNPFIDRNPPTIYNPVGNIGGDIIPDKVGSEPITGFRTWLVTHGPTGLGLRSLHRRNYYWETHTTAECLPEYVSPGKHRSPDPECACGLYAQLPEDPLTEWETMRIGRVAATGTIAMSGRIIVCERGYKAEHAEIVSPVVLDVSCANGGCRRDVNKVQLSEFNESMLAWCPDHKPSGDSVVTVQSNVWLGQACETLSARYGIEFLTWQ